MGWYFIFFFVSGFCSVLYELVWLRLAMAEFGVTTAMVSIVLSVFMAGLGLGSWASGEYLRRHGDGLRFPILRLYAAIELLIGLSGIIVPYGFRLGQSLLQRLGSTSSLNYYQVSGIVVALTMLPACALMGATIPVAMLAIGRIFPSESSRSFSFLYTANVAGAVLGTVLPLFLIELLGFHRTLRTGAVCNVLIAAFAFGSSRKTTQNGAKVVARPDVQRQPSPTTSTGGAYLLALLFATGLSSMGMEVVWVRQFTPYLGTVVYAFAGILCVYLTGTFAGSHLYRRWSVRHDQESPLLWALLALFALFPLVTASPGIHLSKALRLVLGIAPFTGLLGFITPMLVDRWSGGNPAKAGKAYAVNVLGCIVGPLIAGFALLPRTSERWALVLLALPWLILGVWPIHTPGTRLTVASRVASYLLLPVGIGLFLLGSDYEKQYGKQSQVLRDSTATVVAAGSGRGKILLVNGYGMTLLAPVTKMMAHLPLAFLDGRPQKALVVCFGMGTTFRSMRSWGIPVTVVELVPSVPRLFGYFHSDGPEILRNPSSHVVVDDGRRYLERTSEQYDVITIDPPPPVEAAGSSLLYSKDFYSIVRRSLRPGGILQQWLLAGDREDLASVARALQNSFPYVRTFSWQEMRGFHFLASEHPLPDRTARELAEKLPANAAYDLVEWGPKANAEDQFAIILGNEIHLEKLIALAPTTPALSDDRPINEYYVLRRLLEGKDISLMH